MLILTNKKVKPRTSLLSIIEEEMALEVEVKT